MKNLLFNAMKPVVFVFLIIITGQISAQSFEIRGVLPWHNFLSGPTAWNEDDYEKYLDDCQKNNINFIEFHNYTGGGERYFNYVEPMVKIQYKNVLPEAGFDHSGMARWGYLPMKVKDFGFGTDQLFKLPSNVEYFGADCSVLAKTNEERYQKAQSLMQKVLEMAHQRGIQMAMGFEFGVAPPEYASIRTKSDMYWTGEGSLVYNPLDPDACGILYATIDNIIETYKGIDWICLWLNEHCMFGVDPEKALENPFMRKYYDENVAYYEQDGVSQSLKFLGVWAQAYIQKAYDYIKLRAPETKILISGWGSESQMALLLKGLDKSLPRDIVFSMLNPDGGSKVHPSFFKEIAQNRNVWAIPWLESDAALWHLQPRVNLIREHAKQAYADGLDGIVAIHWRTEEIKLNWFTYAFFASNPTSTKNAAEIYTTYCENELGKYAGIHLSPELLNLDISSVLNSIQSPVYYSYNPSWGRLDKEQEEVCSRIIEIIDDCIASEKEEVKISNLTWLRACFEFTLLLNEFSVSIEPAWELRNTYLIELNKSQLTKENIEHAKRSLANAPLEKMLKVFASKVRSRGELGELSSINQRVLREYQLLNKFLEEQHY